VSNPLPTDSSLAHFAAIVIANQRDSIPEPEIDRVRRYLAGGGKALIMESGMQIAPQAPIAMSRPIAWNAVLSEYGVTIRQDMVYDLRAAQMIGVPTQFGRVLRSYPYMIRAQSTKTSPVNTDLPEVGLAWTSSIDTTPGRGVTPLLATTDAGGIAEGTAMVDPAQTFPTTGLAERLLAVQVASADSAGARLIVVGNPIFASDEFVRRSPENLVFALNAVDWLAQDEALIAIRTKDRRPPPLRYESEGLRDAVKYLNVAGLPLLIALAGVGRLVRRRRMGRTPYQPHQPQEAA
jgi:ABC-type uncharacterized transport system involved in gliding motility auxiliary subunit